MAPPQQFRKGDGTGAAVQRANAEIAAGREDEKHGRFPAAVSHYQNALAAIPHEPKASLLLGNLLLRGGYIDGALVALKDAVRVPARAEAAPRHLLGVAFLQANQLADAKRELRKALKLAPASPDVLKSLGNWAMRAQQTADAEDYYLKALARAPNDIDAKLRLATLLFLLGRAADSHVLYREILAAGHAAPVVYSGLVESSSSQLDAATYGKIAALAETTSVSPPERRMLHFAAAKLDRLEGRRDAEFAHYVAGKALLRGFDLGSFAALIDTLISTVTPDFMAARRDFGDPSRTPIFIFGMPRSGTSLIERILAAHPEVGAAGEAFCVEPALIPSGHGEEHTPPAAFASRIAAFGRTDAAHLAAEYLALLSTRGGAKPRITEKTPHNFVHLWMLAAIFPNATYLHAVRDPVATCFSCFSTDFREWHSYTRDLTTLGRYFGLYQKLMRHWQAALPINIVECRYEDLVKAGEDGIRALVAKAGLPWDDACLNFYETTRVSQTASYAQVREPIHSRRVEPWRAYESHLRPLLDALAAN